MNENTINGMRLFLSEMGRKEMHKLWRLARNAKSHGVNPYRVRDIQLEAAELGDIYEAYPERLIDPRYICKWEYAFKLGGVRA